MQYTSTPSSPGDSSASGELVVGVIGGMGPAATADFLAKLAEETPVATEQDHLRVLVDSNAKIPDRNRAIAGERGAPSPGPAIAATARGLQRAGARIVVMACNTAHAFEADIRAAIDVPFVSMVEEAADACRRAHPAARRVGLLATPGAIAAGLYQTALQRRGLACLLLTPDMQQRFTALLYRIKCGDLGEASRAEMRALAQSLHTAGADLLIAGCTEVPLVLGPRDVALPLVDATRNLAQRTVRYARGQEPLPAHALAHDNGPRVASLARATEEQTRP